MEATAEIAVLPGAPSKPESTRNTFRRAGQSCYRWRIRTKVVAMRWIVLACVLISGGCVGEQVTASKPCIVGNQPFNDDGSETPLQMFVARDADRCVIFVGRTAGQPGSLKSTITANPQHGTAEGFSEPTSLVVRGVSRSIGFGAPNAQQLAIGALYRPAKSYVGDDEFRFSAAPMRRGIFRVQVQVVEPAPSR